MTSCYRCTGEWYAASFNTGKIQRCSKVATSDFKRHSQEGESHPKASSPACRLFPVVWATSVGGKVNRNHRPITFDCCQWFLDPIGCQKCNPQVKIQGALNLISHSSIQSSCIIQIFCTSVKPPFFPPIFTMGTQLPIISWSSSGTSCPFMHQKWTRGLM